MDLTGRIEQQQRSDARKADLDRRDKEHGGLTPYDRADEEKRRSVAGWGPYKLETSRADLVQARTNIDPRRVAIGRLWSDCGLAVRRWAKRYKRDAADTLRNDTLLLLLRWEHQGTTPRLDLGGSGGTPRRRDWIETVERADGTPETKLTRLAWRALHAAVKQAVEAPSFLALEHPETEAPTDPLDIAAAVEAQQREAGAATRLPDAIAAETVADQLDIPLDAGRAIVARAYPHATATDLAETWGISAATLKVSLSRGAAAVRQRYPDPTDLLEALDSAAGKFQRQLETVAILRLIDYRDGCGDESDAIEAVRDWRGSSEGMPLQQRAILAAARRAEQRDGRSYGSERAERITAAILRLLPAEMKRAQQRASIAARGSRLDGANVEPRAPMLSAADVALSIELSIKRTAERVAERAQQQAPLPAAPSTRKRSYRGPRFVPAEGCRDCQTRTPHSSHPAQLA